MAAKTFLHGLAINEYRSFGPSLQKMGPFGAINLFAGANNSGKSNILRFIENQLTQFFDVRMATEGKIKLADVDRHELRKGKISIGLALPTSRGNLQAIVGAGFSERLAEILEHVLSADIYEPADNLAWFIFKAEELASNLSLSEDYFTKSSQKLVQRGGSVPELQFLASQMEVQTQGDPIAMMRNIISRLSPKRDALPEVQSVPTFRSVGIGEDVTEEDGTNKVFDGKRIVRQLSALQNHEYNRPEDRRRFEGIQDFFRNIVGDANGTIRIPESRKTIAVSIDGRELNLESLGTGINQTILMAAMATIVNDSIVTLEEPETHLHPIYQRKLLHYLATETTNQYFIATHSAHFLDCRIPATSTSVFRVSLEKGCTVVDRVMTGSDRWEVCRELGYHASDIVQSNCVIWVEGPSDRIYLNHWIKAADENLTEGIHYSLMFYGGSLLCYLTGDDNECSEGFTEFVSLRRLNRNSVIVMDSDKKSAGEALGKHKLRIIEEFKKDGLAWVTDGRTIENYLSAEARRAAFLQAHPNSEHQLAGTGRFHSVKKAGGEFKKTKMAKAAVERPAELDVLDLRQRIDDLVHFIRKSNPEHNMSPG